MAIVFISRAGHALANCRNNVTQCFKAKMSLNMTSILRFGSEEQNIVAFQIGCVKHSQDPRPAHIYITEKETDQTEF